MKPVVALHNQDLAHLGLAGDVFRSEGLPVLNVDAWKEDLPPLDLASAVVSLGGDMNVDEVDLYPYLNAERHYLAEACRRGMPVLGICLGGQLLARGLGAPVTRAAHPELGFPTVCPTPEGRSDPVLSCLRDGDRMFQWHTDTFALPHGASLLVTGDEVKNQAFRAGDRAWGVQFHPEVTADEVEEWLELVPDVERTYGRTKDQVRHELRKHLPAMHHRSRELFHRFAAIVRQARIPSPTE